MSLILALWKLAEEARSIDPTTAWTIIAAEGAFIATLVGWLIAQQKRHEKKVNDMGEKINSIYDKRIEDMRGALELVKTIEGVAYRERKAK